MPENVLFLSAHDAVHEILCGNLKSVDYIKASLEHIGRIDEMVHAFVTIDNDYAISQAGYVDNRISNGINPGSLAGIPIGVKDNFNTRVMPTQMGSDIWKGFTPENDARAVFHLRQNGAVILGKTVTAEFAVHSPNGTYNPHNPDHISGTSSSGSAAAVVTFMVPVALASQTAGSIIRPSSFCGVYGFKPSFGIIPRTGILKTTDTLDTVGFMARNIHDIRLVFDALRVSGPDYPNVHRYLEDPKRQSRTNLPWRVALLKTPVNEYEDKVVSDAIKDFARKIEYNNIIVEEAELPPEFNKVHEIHSEIYDKTLSYYFQSEFSKHEDMISEEMRNLIKHGETIKLDEYKNALRKQTAISKLLDNFFTRHDIIFVPSTSTAAPRLGEREKPDTSLIWTFCGNPAISIPQFMTEEGLPFGIQMVARKYNDYLLMNFVEHLRNVHHMIEDVTDLPSYVKKVMEGANT